MAIVKKSDKYTVNTKLQTKFTDFMSNFEVNESTGDLYRNINDYAVREALKNLILTDFGERPFQPTLGSGVRKLLFENIDDKTIYLLKKEIETAIYNHEPRVLLKDVSMFINDDANAVNITIFYTTINSPGQIQDLTVTLLTRVR
jgi:phage baseplate assembly protein W